LLQGLAQNLFREAVDFDVHLQGRDTFFVPQTLKSMSPA
jgi:hypothetical protein